ncbi:MAG TPA: hypothetical protein VK395_37540 [Gemmataceae bacterium]|nr:hypothetical protein [Gemmataceae bacterium]
MRYCAFLTMASLEGFVSDDELAYAPLRERGWVVDSVPWNRPGVDWARYDAVVIRSTWDYQNAPDAFLAVLEEIKQSGTHLENAIDLVRWNMNKEYLRDLERRGISIVPTVWGSELGPVDPNKIMGALGTDEVVLKPVIGANADHAFRIGRGSSSWSEAAVAFAERAYLAQPFIASVVKVGEYSLFFFDGKLSHTILKKPKPDDFRVQEEHGGVIAPAPASQELVSAAENVMAVIGQGPLYARVDLVQLPDQSYGLMELELIEPSLYLRMDKDAPERFASALDRRVRERAGSSRGLMGSSSDL